MNEELAAPLDLLLINSTRSFAGRMTPNQSWARLGGSLAKQPGTVAGRLGVLGRELASIAAGNCDRAPARADKRFSDPAWQSNPLMHRTMQAYLASADTAEKLFDDAHLDWRDKEKMRFVLDNVVEGLSPSNSPMLSPLGWKALIDTGGLSAVRGLKAFARDMASKPRVPAIVLKTRMFELIQYAPQTPTVRQVPLLMVPPVINKYYIMDIAPGRSMIEYFVQQGQQVFAISWRNPQARHRDWGFDAYGGAIVEALDAVREIAGTDSAHVLATCSGGILAAMVAAHLAEIGEGDKIAGLTLAVTVLDQNRAGFAAAAMSERAAQAAIRSSAKLGYLDGRAMAEMFAWLRPTDLVWRYWVNNYVQGRTPAAFDVLFWNADTTRMTAALHRDMVLTGLHNSLTSRLGQDHRGRIRDRRSRRPHLPMAGDLSQRAAARKQGQHLRAVHERTHRRTGQPAGQPQGVLPRRTRRRRRRRRLGRRNRPCQRLVVAALCELARRTQRSRSRCAASTWRPGLSATRAGSGYVRPRALT
jgi:polyhydroxyalkanoate synthase